ncbi:sensor histidine kinase [Saccharibacillus alkalitolerans]|uniref:histidine kinase n=1 Tax=Saccharibacillus alkalitolerans TaxID=2705290 RepID=A0ABX0F6I4_9BACL|nr:ATP-binding protein [Saccharibacillus alkalitolerans]NGZ75604.1 PAS domain-containing protein [Saccharibacillus alkalitolerans]
MDSLPTHAPNWAHIVDELRSSVTITDATDPEQPLIFVNEHFLRLTGYSREEVIGRNCRFLQGPDTRSETRREIRERLELCLPVRTEILNYRRDGSPFWNEINIDPIFDAEGRCIMFVGLQYDVTDRKLLEEEAARTAQVAHGQSRKLLEFLGKLNHELRNNLNGMLGLLDIVLMDESLPDDVREHLRLARGSGDTMLTIANDALDLARAADGRMKLERIEFRLRQMLESILYIHRLRSEEKGLELRLEVGEELPQRVYGDPHRLRQVLDNLIGNALKFTERGSVTLSVEELEGAPEGNARLFRFTVRDTGIGISAERMDGLFEAFSQADVSHARLYGGAGLGLKVCEELVTLMGGTLSAESREGEGSVFRADIPLLPGEENGALA